MQLVSFSVSNYRSITRAHKLRIAKSTILIAPNNEGKSNILQALVTALRIVSELGRVEIMPGRLRSTRFIRESYDWDRDFPIGRQAKKPDGESVFRLEFALTGQEIVEFRSEVKSNLNGTLPIQISISQKYPHFKVMKKGPDCKLAIEYRTARSSGRHSCVHSGARILTSDDCPNHGVAPVL